MEKYRIRAREIKEKIKYVKEILKRELSPEEEEKVKISLFSYLALLNDSTNTQLSNFLNQITNGKYSRKRIQECASVEASIVSDYIEGYDYVDREYLEFLIDLVNNVAVPSVEEPQFAPINISSEQLMKMSSIFYNSLGNNEIKQGFSQIISKPNSISITTRPILSDIPSNIGGICLYDHVYHQPYVTSYRHDNIKDFLVLNHELMHGIDFLMLEKLYSKTYTGFHETPTYTCDYLTVEFLEQMGFDKNEVEKLRNERQAYFCGLASQVQFQINRRLRKKGIDVTQGYTSEDLKSIMDFGLMKMMLEVESAVLSYGFYQQIKNDKQQGLANFTRFMSSNIPKDRAPDFTSFGLSNDVLLELSQKITLEQKKKKQLENPELIEQQNELQQNNTNVRRLVKPSTHSRAFISSGFLVLIISTISVLLAIFLLTITK